MRRVGIREVEESNPPLSRSRFIPHIAIVKPFIDAILDRNLSLTEILHSMGHSGLRYFGMMDVRSRSYSTDHSWVIAMENNNDVNGPVQISAGCKIFASGVTAFSDEVSAVISSSAKTLENMPGIVEGIVQQIHSQWNIHDQRIDAMKTHHLSNSEMSTLLVEALESGVIDSQEMLRIIRSYRKPNHTAFASRTMWSFYNACMSVKMSLPAPAMIAATTKLSQLFNKAIHFKPLAEIHVQADLI